MARHDPDFSSTYRTSLTQGINLSTNNPSLIRLIRNHPEISKHIQDHSSLFSALHGASNDFCEVTVAAVKKYQKEKGLRVDGVVGSETWRAMGHKPDNLHQVLSSSLTSSDHLIHAPKSNSPLEGESHCDIGLQAGDSGCEPPLRPMPKPMNQPHQRGGGLAGNTGPQFPVDI